MLRNWVFESDERPTPFLLGPIQSLFLPEIGHDAFDPICKKITPPGENPTKGAVISEENNKKQNHVHCMKGKRKNNCSVFLFRFLIL